MQGWGIPETAKADLDDRVDVLDLTPKPANVLAGLRISSIGGLLSVPKPKLLASPGFGSQSMAEVERKVSQYLAGKFADFIVLDKDYMTIPEDQIKDIRCINGGGGRQDRSFSTITRPGNRDATCGRTGGAGWTGIAILKVINNSGAQYGCFPK